MGFCSFSCRYMWNCLSGFKILKDVVIYSLNDDYGVIYDRNYLIGRDWLSYV